MKERENITSIYETYNKLLTEKERTYFKFYYFEDYSLQEIADNFNVSKSYVGKFINNIENKLLKYEESLKINEKNDKMKNLINQIQDEKIRKQIEELL